jgi:hypothetical protein
VLPVVVLLPLPAALTPLMNHLPKSNHTTLSQHKYLTGSYARARAERERERERERDLDHDLCRIL